MKAAAGADVERSTPTNGGNRGIAVLDFVLRILGFIVTLGSSVTMGTTNETLPFFTQFIGFRAEYDDLPTLTFFVVANAIVGGYLILCLAFSIVHTVRSNAEKTRIVLIFFDMAMLALLTAGASAAASIAVLGIVTLILLILVSAVALSRRP
ncbi:hypothetical protein SLE2022_191680 [Rubroshorea leprosula]